jgi:hypothetical protein
LSTTTTAGISACGFRAWNIAGMEPDEPGGSSGIGNVTGFKLAVAGVAATPAVATVRW